MSKLRDLESCTRDVIERLQRAGIYSSVVKFHTEGSRLVFNRDTRNSYELSDLEKIFRNEDIRSSAFYQLGQDNRKATAIAGKWGMVWRRALGEFVAKNCPYPTLKNSLYQVTGINIEDPKKVIIAPNVTMDYIYPQLISIGNGTVIGEDAHVWSHILKAGLFVIGYTEIGRDCTIGERTTIWPGAKIGTGAEIQSGSIISAEVKPGRVVPPLTAITYSSETHPPF